MWLKRKKSAAMAPERRRILWSMIVTENQYLILSLFMDPII